MNARKRVLAVLNRKSPNRIPGDIWRVPEREETFKRERQGVLHVPI